MEKVNYHLKMIEEIDKNKGRIPLLLLHSCCAPCSTQCIDILKDFFNLTIIYYNPNIEPLEEYLKRKSEQIRFLEVTKSKNSLNFLDCDYENDSFKKISLGMEEEAEGGARCLRCYELRLKQTAIRARELNYDYFATTLSVSPYKNSQILNQIGFKLEKEIGVKFLPADFKKNDGYKKSIEFAKVYELYRQDYCGCNFSRNKSLVE